MMIALNYLYVAAAVVLLFGAAVFVHEFGHYWMARRRGMKVEAFAIGFGPKIVGWTKDGIEYSWRWIPAGGYVRLPQMSTSDALEGASAEGSAPVPPASPFSKILVAFSGPFMNLVFAVVIATVIFLVGLPQLVNPSIIGYVEPDSEEARLGIQAGDRIVAVDGKRVSTWQELQQTTILALTNVVSVTFERDGREFTHSLKAVVNESFGVKVINLYPRDHPEIIEVFADSAAAAAGMKPKDIVVAFAGVPIVSREQLIELIQKRGGQASEIRVQRNGEMVSLTVTPKADPTTGTGRIGVSLNRSANLYEVKWPGPTPWRQVADVWGQIVDTVSALVHTKQTGVGAKDLMGPVGILSMLAVQLNTDFRLALNFLVLLNVSLAILNLLPIPVLDGGHIVLSLIEAIRRRPLNTRVVEYASAVFAVLLISFMLYVTVFGDLRRWSVFSAMFKQSAQVQSAPPGATNGLGAPAPAPSP